MKFLIIYILAFHSFQNEDSIDTKYFDVVVHNKVVGELIASKSLEKGITVYKNYTNIKTHIIKDITVSYQYEVSFQNGQMEEADATILLNEKVHEQTKTNWTGNKYLFQKHEEEDSYISKPITNSVVMLLIEEPIGQKSVYSELSGTLHDLTDLGDHVYKKTNENGKKNFYYYKDGYLDRVKVDAGILKFEIKKRATKE